MCKESEQEIIDRLKNGKPTNKAEVRLLIIDLITQSSFNIIDAAIIMTIVNEVFGDGE